MMNNEITIVTAYFDIGRDKKDSRSNNTYIQYFEFWARIKNKIVVYTDSNTAIKIKKIRDKFGLLDHTEIVIIDDIKEIEPELLLKMNKIEKNQEFLKFRYMDNAMDNNALYDYIMLLKSWFIKDAVEKGYAKGMISWLDFGFNHGGNPYSIKEEFNFLWKVSLPQDKVTFFSKKIDDNKPIFHVVQSYEVYMMGAPFIVPDFLSNDLWELEKRMMNSLIDCGFIDDDQTIMLMSSRNVDWINIVKSEGWSLALKENGGEHLTTIKTEIPKEKLIDKLIYKYRVYKRNRKCIRRLGEMFKKNYLD